MTISAVGLGLAAQKVPDSSALAASNAKEKREWETEMQEVRRTKPKEFAKLRRDSTLIAQVMLGRLGYGIGPFDGNLDEPTIKALRLYEVSRKLPATGDPMTFDTFKMIIKDQEDLDFVLVTPNSGSPANSRFEFWNLGRIEVSGSWMIVGDTMANPEQSSTITCDKESSKCIESNAQISRIFGKLYLYVFQDTYDIERWDEHDIVMKRDLHCVRYVQTIRRHDKSVTGTRSSISKAAGCEPVANSPTLKSSHG